MGAQSRCHGFAGLFHEIIISRLLSRTLDLGQEFANCDLLHVTAWGEFLTAVKVNVRF